MSEQPTTPPAPDFAKLPATPPVEDRDGDGLVDPPDGSRQWFRLWLGVKWWLWITDALTTFSNGFIAGFGTAAVVGGASAANTDSFNAQALSWAAALGFMVTAAANGLKHVVIWHDSHPMPNPFRP